MLPSGPTLRHVLVIGVDGVRFDLLGPEVTPVIWGFGSAGFLGPVPVDETTPTWSGPCWATIVTGAGVDGHGIIGNDLTGHRLAEHPDFVTIATRAGLPTLLAVSGPGPPGLPARRRWRRWSSPPSAEGCRQRGQRRESPSVAHEIQAGLALDNRPFWPLRLAYALYGRNPCLSAPCTPCVLRAPIRPA